MSFIQILYAKWNSVDLFCVVSEFIYFNRDIQDLQRRNQTLLQVVRDLSEKKEEEESMAAEEK